MYKIKLILFADSIVHFVTCRSNFQPSSFNRRFVVISSIAHIATSAALPCKCGSSMFRVEIGEIAKGNQYSDKSKGTKWKTCTGVLMAALWI